MTENAEDKKKQEEAARLASAQNEAKEVTSSEKKGGWLANSMLGRWFGFDDKSTALRETANKCLESEGGRGFWGSIGHWFCNTTIGRWFGLDDVSKAKEQKLMNPDGSLTTAGVQQVALYDARQNKNGQEVGNSQVNATEMLTPKKNAPSTKGNSSRKKRVSGQKPTKQTKSKEVSEKSSESEKPLTLGGEPVISTLVMATDERPISETFGSEYGGGAITLSNVPVQSVNDDAPLTLGGKINLGSSVLDALDASGRKLTDVDIDLSHNNGLGNER
ncbi:MAG: hypothetical protein IJ440_04870 [Alphaproteobacteria bacterium]|nr:hypothetical protein [Alphaproteobacteria bacterium]